MPTRSSYAYAGQSVYWGGKGIFLSNEQVNAGDLIKIYLYLSNGLSIKFYSMFMNGNLYSIELGKAYFDFTSNNQDKTYILDLTNQTTKITGKTLGIGVIVYGGAPYIKISLDSKFNQTLSERKYVSATTYLLT